MTAPTDPAQRLVQADRAAAEARARLSATVSTLQARLEPARLADIALTEVQSARAIAGEAAQQHRGALAGTGAVLGLFLLRKPIRRLFRRRRAQSAAEPALPPPATDPTHRVDPSISRNRR